MPKGVIQIKWTPENDTKLLLAIVAVHNIKVDNNAVAKAFGKYGLYSEHDSLLTSR